MTAQPHGRAFNKVKSQKQGRSPEPEHHKPGSSVPGFFLLRPLRLYITYAKERLVVKLCL
jgi:hypothetical protein